MNWRDREVSWTAYGLVVVMGAFIVIKFGYLLPRFSDGNVYLYLSSLVGSGLVPYQDFFYSSPPFILYLFAVYGLIFGFSWQSFVYVPILLTCIDAILIYWIIRRFGSDFGALIGVVLYLLSFAVLATTDFVTDVHVVVTLVLAGVVASEKKWLVFSGFLFALAVLSKLYALVLVVGWMARFIWRREWAYLARFGAAFVGVIGVVSLIMWFAVGREFYDFVILSHVGEIAGLSKRDITVFFAKHDWLLILVPIGWLAVRKKLPSLIVFPLIALAVFYLFWGDVYYLYLKLLVVWLAIWWGWVIASFDRKYVRRDIIVVVTLVLSISAWLSVNTYFSEQAEAAVIYPLKDIAEYVKDNSTEETLIYGAFEVAPIVALEANRKIWKNLADTNIKFFQTGFFDYEERENQIKQDKVPLIITKALLVKGGRLVRGPEEVFPRKFFNENCRIGKTWSVEKDYSHNAIIVWRCDYK